MSQYFEWKKRALMMAASGIWYLPPGVNESDVLAAYQFKGADSAAAALQNLAETGSTYDLVGQRSPTWDASTGYNLGIGEGAYLSSSNLNTLTTIKTIVIRYAGLSTSNSARLPLSLIKGRTTAGTDNPLFWARPNFRITYNGNESAISSSYPTIVTALNTSTNKLTYKVGDVKAAASGVLACDASHIYKDGSAITLTSHTVDCDGAITTESNLYTQYSYTLASNSAYSYYVIAAAFFSKVLSADDHEWMAEKMAEI